MRWLVALWLMLVPVALWAQDQATLVADSVAIAGNDVLVAEGNVEVVFQGRRLSARKITFDAKADRLAIDGPITMTDPDGTVILADQADLAADLTEGILTSARLVFDQQLQLASSEIMRIGNRYTRLGQTVASSCKICAGSATPLWEIRARRVVHDSQARQIYFDNAQIRFGGVPVMILPRLRIPDPDLDRAAGFLIPELTSSSGLGTGLKLPYFIPIGRSKDLTVTPFLGSKGSRSVELRYRQAFRTGNIDISGALSRDRIRAGETRGYLKATGYFALPRGFQLSFSGQTVSDRGYLRDYGLPGGDRLDSRIAVTRTRKDEYISARLIHFYSIREGDVNALLPSMVGDVEWVRRFTPGLIGGTASVAFEAYAHHRASDRKTDSDGDGIGDGRDLARGTVRANWRRDALFGPGLMATALFDLNADLYDVRQDTVYEGTTARLSGSAGVEFRWPLTRTTAAGSTQVIEPVVQLLWAEGNNDDIPNEDSVLAEFDEGNLFALDRLPGADAFEDGPRATVGLSFTHFAQAGWNASFAIGRVYRAEESGVFSLASGLSGTQSDWLATISLNAAPGLWVTNRLVFDDGFDVTKGEFRLAVERQRIGLASSYLWVVADPSEDRTVAVSELELEGRYQLNPSWAARANARYDFTADRAATAGLKMEWRNECLKVDLSLSRQFTSSTSVRPTTDVGLTVELLGFGGASRPGPARGCRG